VTADNHGDIGDAAALSAVYRERFPTGSDAGRAAVWTEVGRYLQRFIPDNASVLDIACDQGYLIRNIRATEKVATDLRDMSAHLPADVRFVQSDGLSLPEVLPREHFDVVTMSNFLEHLPSGDAVIQQLRVCSELLRPGGRVIVLQPNIRLTKGAYWNFIDHKTALTEQSLMEAAALAGFRHRKVITRFIPYTTKSRLPQAAFLVRMYLAFPPAWLLMGKQTLYVGQKPSR
jgi:2-polyprenyl-3-methyl-5-hydroxy-6-metoxy-1,4-benzoquinol methylase